MDIVTNFWLRFCEEGNFFELVVKPGYLVDCYCMDFDYTVLTQKSFDEAVRAVEQETKNAGFKVLYIHDVTATLKEKGFAIAPFKIIEICNARSAYTVLQADMRIGLCLPCKINVYEKDGKTYISGMRPTILSQFFPGAGLGNLPADVDAIIRRIIDRSMH